MAEPPHLRDNRPPFQVPVWEYAYASEQANKDIVLYSPQEQFPEDKKELVLRQVNSDATNKAWLVKTPSLFKRWDMDQKEQLYDDAHGLILQNGRAKPLDQEDDEDAPYLHYSRGDRIWVFWNMDPRREVVDDIPVINLDTHDAFKIPFRLICFVPSLTCPGDVDDPNTEALLAVPVGPVITFYPREKTMSQLFFFWPADEPEKLSCVWDTWHRGKGKVNPSRKFDEYQSLTNMRERQQILDLQWATLSQKLGVEFPHHLPGRDPPRAFAVGGEVVDVASSSSPSNASSTGLDTRWKPGPTTVRQTPRVVGDEVRELTCRQMENCCNLAPKCRLKFEKGVDLVPSTVGGHCEVAHYHVQDDDAECPEGANHKGHCVLRDNKTVCVFSRDIIDHTCCKLRTNPALPGPEGDPHDPKLMPWETTIGDKHFIDVSKNVRTRSELADRDRIPPQLRQAQEESVRLDKERQRVEEQRRDMREQHRQRHEIQNQQLMAPRHELLSQRGMMGQDVVGQDHPIMGGHRQVPPQDERLEKNKRPFAVAFDGPPTTQPLSSPELVRPPTPSQITAQQNQQAPMQRQGQQLMSPSPSAQQARSPVNQQMAYMVAGRSQPIAQRPIRTAIGQQQQQMGPGRDERQPIASPHAQSPSGAPYASMGAPAQIRRRSLDAIPEHQQHNAASAPRTYYPEVQHLVTAPYPHARTDGRQQISEKALGKRPEFITTREEPPTFLLPSQGRELASPAPSPPAYRWDQQASQSPMEQNPFFREAITDAASGSLSPGCRPNVSYSAALSPHNTLPPMRGFDPASMPPPRSPYGATSPSVFTGQSPAPEGHRSRSGSAGGF